MYKLFRVIILLIFLGCIGSALFTKHTMVSTVRSQTLPSTNDIIDQVALLQNSVNANDLHTEIESLVTGFVNDQNTYNGAIFQYNYTNSLLLFNRGRSMSTLAQLLPILPGTISDASTLRGKLAIKLKNEIQNYFFNSSYWDFEQSYDQNSQGSITWYQPPPNSSVNWNYRYRVGPHWEKIYALWSYAYYTGDWTLIQNNLQFILDRYNQGDKTRTHQVYFIGAESVFRDDPVRLALGLIGMTRILDHFNHQLESQVRSEAQTALGNLSNSTFVDRSISQGQVKVGWDLTSDDIRYDYPPCQYVTPEIGRYLRVTQAAIVTNRINEALSLSILKDRYNASYLHNYSKSWPQYDEAQWGLPYVSFQIFDCRAWVLQIDPVQLRKEKPWPVVIGKVPKYMDVMYLNSLYALLSSHATVTWQVAEPN